MEIIATAADMRRWSARLRSEGRSIGFVPTMGALHPGHAELLRWSARDNDVTVLSVFVNPTQFDDPDDFDSYPSTWDHDLSLANASGVDAVFAPSVSQMYPEGCATIVVPGPVARTMEGERRPGHFQGVATVVVKLLHLVQPRRGYFGEKDFQQLAVVRSVVSDLGIDVDIVGVPTVRDNDGLALSSRNSRLGAADRVAAAVIHRALARGRDAHLSGASSHLVRETILEELSTEPRCRVEYVEIVDPLSLAPLPVDAPLGDRVAPRPAVGCVAARFGGVRLIDNLRLST